MTMEYSEILRYVAIALSVVFIVQALVSWFVDFDTDLDFDSSLNVSDFISFKGLVHFLLGFCWTGALNGVESLSEVLIAVAVGVVFFVILAFLYKKVYSLAEEKTYQNPRELIGRDVQLLNFYQGVGRVSVNFDGRRTDMNVKSEQNLKSGDFVRIIDYKDHFLIVETK